MDLSWDDLRFLLAVQQQKSFSRAADKLRVSTSTVIRRVEALERAVGRALVERRNDGVRMSRDSGAFVALAEDMQARINTLHRDETSSPLAGTVRLSVDGGSSAPITRALCEYRRQAPQTVIEIVAEMRLADMSKREADIAFRAQRSKSKVLVERPLGHVSFALYCTREYAERRLPGFRLKAGAFANQEFVGKLTPFPQQVWLEAQGAKQFTFRSDSMIVQRDAALQGAGIVLMSKMLARESRELIEITTDEMFPAMPILLVYHQETRKIPHIMALAKYLEKSTHAMVV